MRLESGAALMSLLVALSTHSGGSPIVKLSAVPFTHVSVTDRFWAPRREANRKVSIPTSFDMLEKAGNMRNFDLAAGGKREGYSGPVFMDSDAYKAIEAAAYSLAEHRDAALERRVDEVIARIAGAQMPDGYLNTWYQVNAPDKRFTNLRDNHEIYCAGHLFEAAVAHFQATGKRTLLDVAVRFADHLDARFGDADGKRVGYCGHPEAELALVKLWKATGERRYFELARHMIENRGAKLFAREHGTPLDRYDGTYWQDDVPIRDHRRIKGHAVRAAYLMSGVTDIVAETGDEGLRKMLGRVWRNTTEKNMYVTGGIGPSASNEGFTTDYDLPNLTAYQETCASIALAQWNHRMALLYGDARYADVMERSLYNGILAGVSQDGKRYFYVNPLESRGNHHRLEWYGCACCPPNVTRTLASLGGYAYAVSETALWVNLYIAGSVRAEIGGSPVVVDVKTDYPWDGKVVLTVGRTGKKSSGAEFELRLRVPGWCDSATFAVNGRKATTHDTDRGYLVLKRRWQAGDTVELNLDMPIARMEAHPAVKDDAGKVAFRRGPIVYCIEQCDLQARVSDLYVPLEAEVKAAFKSKLLGGVTVLEMDGAVTDPLGWERVLYRPVPPAQRVKVRAIPYYAWDNREAGPMRVWIPVAPPAARAGGPEMSAKVSVSFRNANSEPEGIHDGTEQLRSRDRALQLCHWWPHQGTEEWAQYTWSKPTTLCASRVFWFDDTGTGACRLPERWEIQYRDGDRWVPVKTTGPYPVKLDAWCEVEFEPVTSDALRLVVQLQKDWAAGVHEWQVTRLEDDD